MPGTSVAFVGAGYMGREHARAFSGLPGVKLSGVYSRTIERCKRLATDFQIPVAVDRISELFDRTRANLAVVAVAEEALLSTYLEILEYPWAVLLEKPLGINLDQARTIVDQAHGRSQPVFVALNRRCYSGARRIKEALAATSSRRIIHVSDQEDIEEHRSRGRSKMFLENLMYIRSIHTIDLLVHMARGSVRSIRNICQFDSQSPGYVLTKIEFDSGDLGIYEAVWNAPGPWALTVTTPASRWEMRPLERLTVQNRGELTPIEIRADASDIEYKPGMRNQAVQVVSALRGGPCTLPDLHAGLRTMELVSAIYER